MKLPAPSFGARRLLLVGTGAISIVQLPFWLNWLKTSYPELAVQVVLTRSGERFVSRHAVSALTQLVPIDDRWPEEPQPDAIHVRLAEWSDAVVVYPACLNFISRLAVGLADTPALLALQCTTAAIGIAPSLPPGADQNPVVVENLKRLAERRNVVVAPTQPATSLTTGRRDAAGAAPLWTLIESVERLRVELADQGGGEACSN
ncbi:flavoprotein [Solwaraspora sp. WMMD1047]|uniref:flavoprotein n=1 Tax=Solwaraspora sp. WMMD1047 TaxID=3016102 RepID=UPI002416C57D|nr:flavoprotein [Solwaraspora sp. WMMD1047]MDG4827768.1 flavoprotein [Solwaraspora sp. WMMD1047]